MSMYNNDNLDLYGRHCLEILIINDYNNFLNKLVIKHAKQSGVPFNIHNLDLSKNFAYHLTEDELRLLRVCHSIYVNAVGNEDWKLLSKLCKTNPSYEEIKDRCLIVDNYNEEEYIKEHWKKYFPYYNDKFKGKEKINISKILDQIGRKG